VTANATSTVAIWPGTVGGVWGFRRELVRADRRFLILAFPSLVGGLIGAALLQVTPTRVFDRLVPLLILFATLLFLAQDRIQRHLGQPHPHRHRHWMAGAMLFQFLVGVYGGYFGAGIGILMLAALSIMGMTDIYEMSAVKNLFALFINGIAAVYFVAMGMVSWPEAIVMAVGAVAGGVGGAGLARRAGRRAVRWAVVGIGFTMAASLALRL
jgi:uncharacterized protein